MPDSASSSSRYSTDRLGAVGRVLMMAIERGETTLSEIERQIGTKLAFDSGVDAHLLGTWAALVYARAATERSPSRARRASPTCTPLRRSSKKGRPPDLSLGQAAQVAQAVNRLRLNRWNRRRELVQREHHEFRGPAIANALLSEALAALPGNPEDSGRWAELAGLAVGVDHRHYCASDAEQAALGLRADLFQANTLRCLGALDEAEKALRSAIVEALQIDLRDPTFWAEAKWFVASLRRAQRRFPEALLEAHLSAALWAEGANPSREVLSLWLITSIYEQLAEPLAALQAIRRAVAKAQKLDDPKLSFGVRHGEVACLARAGLFEAAAGAYSGLQEEYASYPTHNSARLTVLALIAAGQGRPVEAEANFRAARDGFLASGQAYDAALVTLDWSLFLLDQNRPEEVLPLAISMGQAFEALGVARETLASWAIFQAAAERRELTRAVAESMVRTLGEERAGERPGR